MADVLASEYALSKSSEHSNYNEVKESYLKQVKMYYANRKLPVMSPFTREVVDRIKKLLKERQFLMSVGRPSEHVKYKVAHKYEVIEQNGEDILICKRLLPDDPIVQIVPAEDCFDILVDAHLETNHGGKEKMLRAIKKGKYVVPKTSIDFLLVVCKVCNLNGRTKRRADERIPQIFNSRGQVSLVDMTEEPDNQFKHILCYIDRFTSFMLLRPLMTDTVQETAMELLKIFFDFGPPDKLETYNRPFFNQVMSIINTAHSKFNINLVLPVKIPVITPVDVKGMLRKWQTETGSSNWAMGCYMVQWNNNSEMNINKLAPYFSVFKRSFVGKGKEDKRQGNEKPWENRLNTKSATVSAPSLTSRDDNSQSSSSTILDGDSVEVLIVHQENGFSENDEDCLITITEAPNESESTLPLTTVSFSNKQRNYIPNILKKKHLEDSSHNNVFNVNEPLLVLSPFKNIANAKNNNRILKEQKQDESKNSSKPSNKRCHVCKTRIKKAYICTKCNRNVHLFCSDRLLQPYISSDVLSVICTSCTLTKRNEKTKRKYDEIDNDKSNIITIKD
ncbi:KRAB-A domain-containing protein 2-like [Cydia pomonella]|uniref:KRAB-A domain-containing protein 2-like n=1 Tax=Cydia pomonella TaxID=82600 RepID=UPI002ADD9301|nr:KRAB-A domain-containing protein 2-like [Cydia pomonella]